MPEAGQAGLLTIAYKGRAAGDSYERWREQLASGFCRLDIAPSSGEEIDCRVRLAALSHLVLGGAEGASGRFARTPGLIADGRDDLVLVAAAAGPVAVSYKSTTIALRPSEMCLTELGVPTAAAIASYGCFATMRIPRRALLEVYPRAEERLSRPLHGNAALASMVCRYLAVATELAHGLDAAAQRNTAEHLVALLGLLLHADGADKPLSPTGAYAAARLDVMKADVLERLGDAGLTIAAVAGAHGLSPRHAQRLFAQSGTTFGAFLMEQRLLLARRLLASLAHRHSKVSTIAFASGFGDLSHFNRTFRRRFGVTPSEFRAGVTDNG